MVEFDDELSKASNCNFLETLGMTKSPSKFSSVAWIDSKDSYGLIAGGTEEGAVTLWDAKMILEGAIRDPALAKLGLGCVSA